MTVHMETVYAADKNVTVSTFPGTRGRPCSSDASMSTSRVGRSYNIYFLTGQQIPGIFKLDGCQLQLRTVFPDLDISLNVSFTSMTVHMETSYADKNVTGFDVSWIPHGCHG
jgi:hypothetical protein